MVSYQNPTPAILFKFVTGFVTAIIHRCSLNQQVHGACAISQRRCEMKLTMPKTLSGWCMWLFFLVMGLSLIPAIGGLLPAFLAPLFALAYAVLSLIGM